MSRNSEIFIGLFRDLERKTGTVSENGDRLGDDDETPERTPKSGIVTEELPADYEKIRLERKLRRIQEELVFVDSLADFQLAMNQRAGLGEISLQEENWLSLKFLTLVDDGQNIPEGMDEAHWAALKKVVSARNRGEFWEAIVDRADLGELSYAEKQAIDWKNKNIGDGERAGFYIDRRKAVKAREILDEINWPEIK